METKFSIKNFGLKQKIRDFLCAEGTYGEIPLPSHKIIENNIEEVRAVKASIEGKAIKEPKQNNGNGSFSKD